MCKRHHRWALTKFPFISVLSNYLVITAVNLRRMRKIQPNLVTRFIMVAIIKETRFLSSREILQHWSFMGNGVYLINETFAEFWPLISVFLKVLTDETCSRISQSVLLSLYQANLLFMLLHLVRIMNPELTSCYDGNRFARFIH